MISKITPKIILKIRSEYKKSQNQMADILGVSTGTFSNWENGKTKPKGIHEEILKIMATVLKKEPDVPNYVKIGKPSRILFTILDMYYGNL